MEIIDLTQGESIALNPLKVGREAPELLVDLLEKIGEVTLDEEQKLALRAVIAALPNEATMRDLIGALKTKEAADMGITLEQYEALTPLFLALQAVQAEGAYSHLFAQAADR